MFTPCLRRLMPALALITAVELPAQRAAFAAAESTDTPAALIQRTLDAFARGTPEAFDSIYPFPDARQLVRWSVEAGWPRIAAGAEVVHVDGDRAVIQLAGYPVTGSSGYETSLGRMFTGLYEAKREAGRWSLARRLPMAAGNRILSHRATVTLRPGDGLDVRDTMAVSVGEGGQLWLVLNRIAELTAVEIDGRPAPHEFAGGLLRIQTGSGDAVLGLAYTLDARRDTAPNANFARLERDFGNLRDQSYWLPFFGFDAPESVADFAITVTTPVDYQVVTGLPQRDTVIGGLRRVTARSARPTAAVTLMYDRAWSRTRRSLGAGVAELFLGDSVEPSRQAIDSALTAVHSVLARRFGDPTATYVALVQGRALGGWGWLFRSNDMVVAGHRGGPLERAAAVPRALFGHEVAHGWTSASGAGRNLLSEGWAMYAEGMLIRASQGADAERRFWEWMRTAYHTEGHEGRNTLIGDDFNQGVSYTKGGWVLRMLEDALGPEVFDRGMRRFMALPRTQGSSIEAFAAAMTSEAAWDVEAFLAPWLEESRIPRLEARVDDRRIIVRQDGPVFRLPLDIDLVDSRGKVTRQRVWIGQPEDTLALDSGVEPPVRVRLDPDHRLLMHRTEGDTVRLAVEAPEARQVVVRGSFTSEPIAATRNAEGRWTVELPITEGVYSYFWVVDGKRRDSPHGGVLEVRAAKRLEQGAYPRARR